MDNLLTTREVCKLLKVHRVTLYRWIAAGKVKAKKLEGRLRFEAKVIEAMVKAR